MILTYKYRIYPNKEQREIIAKNLDFCRFVYNSCLQERREHYKWFKKQNPNYKEDKIKYKGITGFDQCNSLTDIKPYFKDECKTIFAQTLQNVTNRVNKAFEGFFTRCKKGEKPGYPRFKNHKSYNSFLFPQCNFTGKGGVKLSKDKKHIIVHGIGDVKIEYQRPFEGDCKTVLIIIKNNKYHVCLTCDNIEPVKNPIKTGKTIGIDLGITNYIKTSDNETYYHPKPYKTAKEKLAYHQRKLALKQKGSNNRKRQVQILANCYEKVANVRRDFTHKLVNKIVKENDVIIIEDLNVKNMMESSNPIVKKSNLSDVALGETGKMFVYKAERAGKQSIKVNCRGTSRLCSGCGTYNGDLTLNDRIYICPKCGLNIDRDLNAAINIKNRGLGSSLAITC